MKIVKREVVLHPTRQDDSAERWFSGDPVVLLVDGLTAEKLNPDVVEFLNSASEKQLSVHAKTGTYKGQSFDNSVGEGTLFISGEQVVMDVFMDVYEDVDVAKTTVAKRESAKNSKVQTPSGSAIQVIVDAITSHDLVWITGASGSGKDYLAREATKSTKAGVIPVYMDNFGHAEDEKWITDIDGVEAALQDVLDAKKKIILIGMSDNMMELESIMNDISSEIFFVVPEPTMYKEIMAAKASDLSHSAVFRKGWTEKSKLSPSKVRSYFNSKFELFKSKFKSVVRLENDVKTGDITNGFDQLRSDI